MTKCLLVEQWWYKRRQRFRVWCSIQKECKGLFTLNEGKMKWRCFKDTCKTAPQAKKKWIFLENGYKVLFWIKARITVPSVVLVPANSWNNFVLYSCRLSDVISYTPWHHDIRNGPRNLVLVVDWYFCQRTNIFLLFLCCLGRSLDPMVIFRQFTVLKANRI